LHVHLNYVFFYFGICLTIQFAELYIRGWTEEELAGLAGENLLRVFKGVEETAARLRREGRQPEYQIYEKRKDL
jgi:membrane dipeptidase